MGSSKQLELLRAGSCAPVFPLTRLEDGTPRGTVDLANLWQGRPVLLAFFKSTCPVCQMTMPFLERVYQNRLPGSLEIYGISQDDAATTTEFAAEFGIHFPMLLDTEESGYPASNAYGLSHVPSLFLIEPGGRVTWSEEGFVKREFVAMAATAGVDPFLPGEPVPEWKAG